MMNKKEMVEDIKMMNNKDFSAFIHGLHTITKEYGWRAGVEKYAVAAGINISKTEVVDSILSMGTNEFENFKYGLWRLSVEYGWLGDLDDSEMINKIKNE